MDYNTNFPPKLPEDIKHSTQYESKKEKKAKKEKEKLSESSARKSFDDTLMTKQPKEEAPKKPLKKLPTKAERAELKKSEKESRGKSIGVGSLTKLFKGFRGPSKETQAPVSSSQPTIVRPKSIISENVPPIDLGAILFEKAVNLLEAQVPTKEQELELTNLLNNSSKKMRKTFLKQILDSYIPSSNAPHKDALSMLFTKPVMKDMMKLLCVKNSDLESYNFHMKILDFGTNPTDEQIASLLMDSIGTLGEKTTPLEINVDVHRQTPELLKKMNEIKETIKDANERPDELIMYIKENKEKIIYSLRKLDKLIAEFNIKPNIGGMWQEFPAPNGKLD